MKIWNSKNQKINQKVDAFLSGEDINLDNEIINEINEVQKLYPNPCP